MVKFLYQFLSAITPFPSTAARNASLYSPGSVQYYYGLRTTRRFRTEPHEDGIRPPTRHAPDLAQGSRWQRTTTEVARSVLAHDESQVEYYDDVTMNMVGRVLRSYGIVEKEDDGFSLIGYEDLDDEQVEHLIELCEAKLDEYKTKRGKRIWQHRKVCSSPRR